MRRTGARELWCLGDLVGYGADVPHARWPGGARIAMQFVLNYEEGGENNVLHGDPTSETFLSEMVTAQAYENRHMTMESMYEYGSRVGVWRMFDIFDEFGVPSTCTMNAKMGLERRAVVDAGQHRGHQRGGDPGGDRHQPAADRDAGGLGKPREPRLSLPRVARRRVRAVASPRGP